MPTITNTIVYFFLFVSLYFEVFILITYFEKRFDIQKETRTAKLGLKKYPSVTIIVPCWNEELTISKTIHSLLSVDYPKDKLKIIIVDDGSTDGTWNVAQNFARQSQIEIYHKENGGKHTALNFGLSKVTTDLVGCLDADSYIDKDMLKNLATYFEDKKTMAVTPSVKVWQPKNAIQMMQKVEYGWGIFIRKMFSYMGALYVTPGPGTLFRKEVFEKIGGYKHAHLTEDMEIAMRMQKNHYKIANSHNAYVYTVAPNSVKKLYKQRLRWTYGFIKNAIDYRSLFFKKEYGNLGMFILPLASLSLVSALYVALMTIIHFGQRAVNEIIKIQTVGLNMHWPQFSMDIFMINTQYIAILTFMALLGMVTIIFISRKLSEGHMKIRMDLVYFMTIYSLIVPFWIAKAVYNTIFSVNTTWR